MRWFIILVISVVRAAEGFSLLEEDAQAGSTKGRGFLEGSIDGSSVPGESDKGRERFTDWFPEEGMREIEKEIHVRPIVAGLT